MDKAEIKPRRKYTVGEEIFNSISHGVGGLLSIAACVLLIVWAALYGDALAVVANSIFGASLIILYTMSTLYHAITNEKAKAFFRIMDHTSIFFLIAGTYTPITLCAIARTNPGLGWTLFGIVWATAIIGIVFNSISIEKYKKISVVAYIVMGWIVIIALKPLIDNYDADAMWYLFGGGAFYTIGVVFYSLKNIKWMHCIWHLFTIAGSVLHFFYVFIYITPISK